MNEKPTMKEWARGILELVLPFFLPIWCGYLLGNGWKIGGVIVGVVSFLAYRRVTARVADISSRMHGARLAKMDGETATPAQVQRLMSRDMFETDKTYIVEEVYPFRDTNLIVIQEEGCPMGTHDTVRVFTTRKQIGRRLRFFIRRNHEGSRIWDFESVGQELPAHSLTLQQK